MGMASAKPFVYKTLQRLFLKSKKTTELKFFLLVLSFDCHDKKLNNNL